MTEEEKESETGERKGGVTRRQFLKYAGASAGLAAASLAIAKSPFTGQNNLAAGQPLTGHGHPVGIAAEAETEGGITPMQFLREPFYHGEVDAFGTRRFTLNASSAEITVAKGVKFPAWAFGWPQPGGGWAHHVPGPTLRCTEGEQVEFKLINGDSRPHTIHLHGIHPAEADGVFEEVLPGEEYIFPKFKAEPFGMFLYHCHVMPVKKHISKGLYGAFIVDPPASYGARPPADELVMVMNGYDLDFDNENEFYSVNGIPNYYFENPINIQRGRVVRIYLVNMTEFDPVNSFHLHGNMFRLYRTGTRFTPTASYDETNPDIDAAVRDWLRDDLNRRDPYAEITDNVFLGQGERAVLEFVPKYKGRFLFHAHQSEFLELGWTGLFNVT